MFRLETLIFPPKHASSIVLSIYSFKVNGNFICVAAQAQIPKVMFDFTISFTDSHLTLQQILIALPSEHNHNLTPSPNGPQPLSKFRFLQRSNCSPVSTLTA